MTSVIRSTVAAIQRLVQQGDGLANLVQHVEREREFAARWAALVGEVGDG